MAWLSDLAVGARRARAGHRARSTRRTGPRVKTPWRKAAAAYVSGDFQAAAAEYSAIGALPEEADAQLHAAETLVRSKDAEPRPILS